MSSDLAQWLAEQQEHLLARWHSVLGAPIPSAANGYAGEDIYDGAPIPAQIFDDLIEAAGGSTGLLDEHLLKLDKEDWQRISLPELVHALFSFRRIAGNALRETCPDPSRILTLATELDLLIERLVNSASRVWVSHTDALIQEREFIAESLDSASAAADRRALQLKALNEISQSLSASLESNEVLNLVGSSLSALLGVAHIAIWLPEAVGADGVVLLRAVQTWGDEAEPVQGMLLDGSLPTDPVRRAFCDGALYFEMRPDPATMGAWHQPGCGVLTLPIITKDQVGGVVSLQDPNPVEQLRFQQDLAEGVVNQTAIALENARLYATVRELNAALERRVAERTRELQNERDRLRVLNEVMAEVSSTLDLDRLLRITLEMLARITQAERGSIMLLEPDNSNLLVNRAVLNGEPGGNFTRFPVGTGIAGWVAQYKRPALIADLSIDDRWISLPEGSLSRREGAMIAVPLIAHGGVIGVLTLSHQQTGFFNDDHLRLLLAAAGSIAMGINNANFYNEIVAQYEHSSELQRRLQTEASQTAAILQSLSDGVLVCDLYGSVLSANPAASQILQRNTEDLVIANLHDLLKRYLGARAEEMPLGELLARPLGHHEQVRTFSCDAKVSSHIVRMTLGPVLKEDGELLGALLVLRDITLEIESDRLKTEFIGTMSHELRTPMTAIKGFTQLLAMGGLGPLTDTQREFVNTIYANTERMIVLINDVLDITKIESGSVDLELRSLHLAEALSGVVAEVRPLISARNHELTLSIPPGLPLVRADANRLHQVLYNLISNAIKYTPRGGKIWVEAHEADLAAVPEEVRDSVAVDRRYVQANIRDTGVGIAEEELEKIFQRFYRTENPLKIEAGGTGLGLSLVKPLIELLGGKIWVQSQLNEGSTFSFILPAS